MNGRKKRRAATTTMYIIVAIIVVIVAATMVVRGSSDSSDANQRPDLFTVKRGGFPISIPASGELAALKQEKVDNKLEGRAVVTFIVDEGVTVKEGDVLVRLDDDTIQDRIKDIQDTVNNAENSWISAQSNLEIQRQANASELAAADLRIELAQLALDSWREGDSVSQRTRLQLDLETAEKDYDRLVALYEASKDLLEKEFISLDEYRRDEISMIRARSALDQAKLALKVYNEYTYEQDKATKESDLQQAIDERSRTEQKHANEITQRETDVESKLYQFESQKVRLAEAQRDLEMCAIVAPQDGLVVYATSLSQGRRRGGDDTPPQVGTELYRNQTVIFLPDTSKMIAEVKVNEALSGRIKPGQRVVIVSDAVPDESLEAEVLSVGVLAESGDWVDRNRRDYTVRIALLNGNDLGLKPAMRCKAEIFVSQVEDALHVPIQACFRKGPIAYVYVPQGSGYAEKPVTLGRSSELYTEITEGLEEGDSVLLRKPSAERIVDSIKINPSSGPTNGNGAGRTPRPNGAAEGGGAPGGPRGGGGGRSGRGGGGGGGGTSSATGEATEKPAKETESA